MKRARSQDSSLKFWAQIAAAFLVALLLTVWEHVQSGVISQQLKILHAQADRLTYENARMQMQVHQWVSPSHLDQIAREEYHLAPLDGAHTIGLKQP